MPVKVLIVVDDSVDNCIEVGVDANIRATVTFSVVGLKVKSGHALFRIN